jgi:hypothetical protein
VREEKKRGWGLFVGHFKYHLELGGGERIHHHLVGEELLSQGGSSPSYP